MNEIKTEDVFQDFSSNTEVFDFTNYLINSKYHDDSNKLVIGKKKAETGAVAIEEFVGLKIFNVWDIQLIEFKVKVTE